MTAAAIVYFLVLFNPSECPNCEVAMTGPYSKKTCETLQSAFDQFQLAQCVAVRVAKVKSSALSRSQ